MLIKVKCPRNLGIRTCRTIYSSRIPSLSTGCHPRLFALHSRRHARLNSRRTTVRALWSETDLSHLPSTFRSIHSRCRCSNKHRNTFDLQDASRSGRVTLSCSGWRCVLLHTRPRMNNADISKGTVADLWDMQKSGGTASLLFVLMPFLGPTLGINNPFVLLNTLLARYSFVPSAIRG